MAFKLFKNGDELYDDSQELIKRGEFDKARDYLIKSIDKEGGTDDVAAVQVALIDLKDRLTNVNAYQNLLDQLQNPGQTYASYQQHYAQPSGNPGRFCLSFWMYLLMCNLCSWCCCGGRGGVYCC